MLRIPIRRLLTTASVLGLLCAASSSSSAQDDPRSLPPVVSGTAPEEVLPREAVPVVEARIASGIPYAAAPDPYAPRGPVCSACAQPAGASGPCRCQQNALSRWWNGSAKPCLQESHWGYCNYFDPPPFGAALRQAVGAQVAAGLQAQLVLYQYDFHSPQMLRSAELNERGCEQLARMAEVQAATGLPIVVELIPGNPQLSLQRRAGVVQLLQQHGLTMADQRVVLRPVRSGLSAEEAILIYGNLLQQIGQAGTSMGTAPPPSSEP